MRAPLIALLTLALTLPAQSVWAWGSAGHQNVGGIAERMLTKNAYDRVNAILGFKDGKGTSLREASVWADCLRDVERTADGRFEYKPDERYRSAICDYFAEGDGKARMENYIARNWSNCVYAPGQACALAFHFVNLPIQADGYAPGLEGTSDHDVVHAINAAIAKLEGRPVPAPFDIKDDWEALMLLAHFVGDLHQPLHVGSVYLDKDGRQVNPATGSGWLLTRGGNSLTFPSDRQNPNRDGVEMSNLHSDWDGISFGDKPTRAMVAAALRVPVTGGPLEQWCSVWAGESLGAARTAFGSVAFGPAVRPESNSPKWPVRFDDRGQYISDRTVLQRERIVLGSARLAQVLNRIWP
jgi:hypothetical protein